MSREGLKKDQLLIKTKLSELRPWPRGPHTSSLEQVGSVGTYCPLPSREGLPVLARTGKCRTKGGSEK